MDNESAKQFRLGVFIISGTVLLLLSIYLIGLNQDLFGPTIRLQARFRNVNGLQAGNNVRFAGSDAGSVEAVEVVNDSAVLVTFILQERYRGFIRTDAIATISTDGLMGNKLINIINVPGSSAPIVQNGASIATQQPVETDEMLRTLDQTNVYVSGIALNLKNITDRVGSSKGTVWKLLTDTTVAGNVDSIVLNMQQASKRVAEMSTDIGRMVKAVNRGKGLLGTLTTDTVLTTRLQSVMDDLDTAGQQAAQVSSALVKLVSHVEQGNGTLGMLLKDTALSSDLRVSIRNLRQGSESLNQSLEAIQKVPILKKYLEEPRRKEKK